MSRTTVMHKPPFLFLLVCCVLFYLPTRVESALVSAKQGMVASQEKLASQVGVQILQQGGNAIDAAVAVGYALAVTLPEAGNIGGGGFMLVHLAKDQQTVSINYRESAPNAAHRDMYLDKQGQVDISKVRNSLYATGIPGTVAGLNLALEKYGTLPLKQVIQPAIDLAEQGFAVYPDLAKRLAYFDEALARSPEGKRIFFDKTGKPLQAGSKLIQKNLAKSLKRIAKHGNAGFYQGPTAKAIAADMKQYGGAMTQADLANYQAEILKPIRGTYRGYEVFSMPPPSSGGIALVSLLNIMEGFPLNAAGFHDAKMIHTLVEAMNYVYADRSLYLGDPDFVDVPVKQLTSKQYAQTIRNKLQANRHQPATEIKIDLQCHGESDQTTHYSVIDKDGNMVSNTYTLNSPFGNGHVVTGTGILLNNEMDDFSAKACEPNQFGVLSGKANAVAPGKQPLSSMTPTIVLDKAGKPYLATGSPGGSRIITTVLQTLLNTIDYEMNIYDALAAPRFHSQWYPDSIRLEQAFAPQTEQYLEKLGHQLVENPRPMGSVQSVMRVNDKVYGATDPRRDGLAVGY